MPRRAGERRRGAAAARKGVRPRAVPVAAGLRRRNLRDHPPPSVPAARRDGERARDETVKAFHDLYRKNPAEFPPEAKESALLELLRLSYPIHPELFDRLSKDWASLRKISSAPAACCASWRTSSACCGIAQCRIR